MSDALVYHNGLIVWKPPSIYKSFCPINIEYFPYDSQSCTLKFGGWSYNGFLLDVRQLPSADSPIINREDESGKEYQYLEKGMDLSGFYQSLEWDLMSLTSQRHEQLYPGCCGQDFYIDVTFDIALRRKTLFYTVNLVIPCMLIGRYLLFTMFLVAMSILLSVLSLNYYRRDGSAHPMPHWMQAVFIETLPKFIGIKKAEVDEISDRGSSTSELGQFLDSSRRPSPYFLTVPWSVEDGQKRTRGEINKMRISQLAHLRGMHPDLIRRMIDNVSFIADHFRAMKKEDKISSDWSYVANVIDRLVLIVFTFVNLVGTVLIIQNSPLLFDHSTPMKIGSASRPLSGDTFENAFDANFTQESWWRNSEGL
ncbi:Neurotransmitter-gated ion-channel transmembrane region [Dictyocaulus viviparus]|uniref:Neurotransmitter-gated ion-channel transmembrane region n=1 Tax=Dictyocaulus viviparus TaxID=29172 RepID=A0A0D8XUM4_DICVI|nr:Neurotransmitter-gated ion-channel transmembrane region [Dictyocaulus viviparus]